MGYSNDLFQLIQSLSKSEKRYFKLMASLQNGEKNYMRLFDAIEKQKVYDEKAIVRTFAGKKFIQHLSSEKNYLYHLILKSLRGHYSDDSAAVILQDQLRNIELLHSKALYKHVDKIIRKAKKIAYAFEKYHVLLSVLEWQKKLIEQTYLKEDLDVVLHKVLTEEKECIEKLNNISQYDLLYSQLKYRIRDQGFARTAAEQSSFDSIVNSPLIIDEHHVLTVKASVTRYYIIGFCALLKMNYLIAQENFRKVIDLLDKDNNILKELPMLYAKAHYQLFFAFLRAGDLKKSGLILDRLKGLLDRPMFSDQDLKINLSLQIHAVEMSFYGSQENLTKIIEDVIPNTLAVLTKNKSAIGDMHMPMYYGVSRAYFEYGDFKNALKYVNVVLNVKGIGLRKDIYVSARLLSLLIHYELGNYELLGYQIKSVRRYLKRRHRNYDFEEVFLRELKKLIKNSFGRNDREMYVNFKKELLNVFESSFEKVIGRRFDFMGWLDAKIEGKKR